MAGFELFPAIDLAGGRLARLGPGGRVEALAGDPIEAAQRYVSDGARWIHVVDLDAALTGDMASLDMLGKIASLRVSVQAGGGLSTMGVEAALEGGAARAILGAAALADLEMVAGVVRRHGDRAGVGIDARQGVVAPRGSGGSGPPLADVLPGLAQIRPAFVVYTNVERDGAMTGPDTEGLLLVARAVGSPVVASGGIRSIHDLLSVAGVEGVAGAIVGRALQEAAFSLKDALAALGGPGS